MPLMVDKQKILRITFWRLGTKKKVWYEWQPEVICETTKNIIIQLKIHNFNGKYYSIEK